MEKKNTPSVYVTSAFDSTGGKPFVVGSKNQGKQKGSGFAKGQRS